MFEEWLIEELNIRYQIPPEIGEFGIKNDQLALLLDGFDEVKKEYQETCIEAINAFRQKHMTDIVICSRIADYEELATKFKLRGAILLQTLTDQEIDKYLMSMGNNLAALREILHQDIEMRELAKTPLALSIMSLIYTGKSLEELSSIKLAHHKHLFDAYIEHMIKNKSTVNTPYKAEQTISWLSWLAQTMFQHNKSRFSPKQLQIIYLDHASRWVYVLCIGLYMGLPIGLIFGKIFGPITGVISGIAFGLIFSMLYKKGNIIEPVHWRENMPPIRVFIFFIICGFLSGLLMFWFFCWILLADIQYYTLRFILYRKGHIPRNYINFLDYAVRLIFLQKVANGYNFIHPLLQQHFAAINNIKKTL